MGAPTMSARGLLGRRVALSLAGMTIRLDAMGSDNTTLAEVAYLP
jgi:hypothetical protein